MSGFNWEYLRTKSMLVQVAMVRAELDLLSQQSTADRNAFVSSREFARWTVDNWEYIYDLTSREERQRKA